MRRGEVWTAATGGGFGGQPRSVLVVQSDLFRRATETTLVALFTSDVAASLSFRPRIEPDPGNGLELASDLMVDIMLAVRPDQAGRRIGVLSGRDMERVEQAMLLIQGFAG